MNLSNLEYSRVAKHHLKNKWCYTALFSILYIVPFLIPRAIFGYPGYIVQFLFSPLLIGFNLFYLRIAKGEPASYRDLFFAFRSLRIYFKAFALYLLSILLICFGILLLIVPGIYIGMCLAQVYFIFVEEPNLSIK